jgi:hypothetical protein
MIVFTSYHFFFNFFFRRVAEDAAALVAPASIADCEGSGVLSTVTGVRVPRFSNFLRGTGSDLRGGAHAPLASFSRLLRPPLAVVVFGFAIVFGFVSPKATAPSNGLPVV